MIDGNDQCKGHVKATALDALIEDKNLAQGLRKLELVDQMYISSQNIQALSKTRRKLELNWRRHEQIWKW